MGNGYYGKEPFDLRLTILRLWKQLPTILLVTVLGIVLFGGTYWLCHVLGAEETYQAESLYHVEYAVESEAEVGTTYINATTWNSYLQSSLFLDEIQARLDFDLDVESLSAMLSADLASDLRAPSTFVASKEEATAVTVATALEEVMCEVVPSEFAEVVSVSVVNHADKAIVVKEDARPVRAFVLSAFFSCFFVIIVLLLKELGEDAIWIPATISFRYGLKTLGTVESDEFPENFKFLFGDKRTAICPVQDEIDPSEVLTCLKKYPAGAISVNDFAALPSPMLCPETVSKLREAEAVMLVLKAGKHAGKQMERVLEFMRTQETTVTGVLLWEADEKLIRRYYFAEKLRKK